MEAMFEKASRLKLRFSTPFGLLNAEDLWHLPLSGPKYCLDELAKSLHRELKMDEEESFVTPSAKPDEELILRFEIVKRIVKVKLKEKEAAEKSALRREKKQKIMSILVDKENEELKAKTVEELEEMLDTL